MSSIGIRIKELRSRRGLTQDQIAEKLNMNRANFSHYERGTSIPPGDMLGKIADILNTTTDYLLGRTEPTQIDDFTIDMAKDIMGLPPEKRELVRAMIKTMIKTMQDQ
jgi:transcriptional regulator with XRE-family HTH domain